MTRTYQAVFTDKSGSYATQIVCNGALFQMQLPGMTVESNDLEAWEMADDQSTMPPFEWSPMGELVYSELRVEIPLEIWQAHAEAIATILVVEFYTDLRDAREQRLCKAHLCIEDASILIGAGMRDVEDVLEMAYAACRPHGHLKTCQTCVWSDVQPSASCMTDLMCFQAKDRARYLEIMTDPELSPKSRIWRALTEFGPVDCVKATWDCNAYSPRRGIGYFSA